MASVFVELARHLRDGRLARPWFGPHTRIFHRELIEDRFRVDAGEAFDHVQVLGSRKRTQIREIGGVDHQRIALPVAHRIAHPLLEVLSKMLTTVPRTDAYLVDLPSFN